MGMTNEETQLEREIRLGGFRNARVLRREIARRSRGVKPVKPEDRVRRRVMVDGRWVVVERQNDGR